MAPVSEYPPPSPHPQGALGPYLRAIAAHRTLVILTTFAAVAVSVLWISVRPATYDASASLLVTPLPQEDETFLGLQLIRDSGDPTRTVQTAAALLESTDAAQRAARELDGDWTAKRVLDSVSVNPEGESNVLAVKATADSPGESARLANVFARATLGTRLEALREQAAAEIARLRAHLKSSPSDPNAAAVSNRISQLEAIETAGDPTLAFSQKATLPNSPADTPAAIILSLAAIAGFALGSGAALIQELTRRQVRDEEEALALYPLPVLTRSPLLKEKEIRGPEGSAWHMAPAVWEAFRTLLVQLDGIRATIKRTPACLVTSASIGDGKTTSAVNLAVAAASGGQTVALLDFDLRKPDLGSTLHVGNRARVADLLQPEVEASSLLAALPTISGLEVLAVEADGDDLTRVEALAHRLPELIDEARESFDLVVIDTAPLGQISDALRLVDAVDAVFIVTRPGHTLRVEFETTRDLIERIGHAPAGLIVIGDRARPRGATYYDYAKLERPLFASRPDGQ